MQRVKQKLECSVGLRAELRSKSEQHNSPFIVANFHGTELVLQVFWPADPSTQQRIVGGVANDGARVILRKRRQQLERWTIQKISRRSPWHSVSERVLIVHQDF